MPTSRVTHHQAIDTSFVPLIAPPNASENFGKRARRLLNERAAAATLLHNPPMDVTTEPAPREQPPRPDTSTDAVLYHKLKTTLEVIFVSGWGEFITQYQFNKLDNRMSKDHRQDCGRDSRGTQQGDEHGRQTYRKVHHPASLSRDGQEVKRI